MTDFFKSIRSANSAFKIGSSETACTEDLGLFLDVESYSVGSRLIVSLLKNSFNLILQDGGSLISVGLITSILMQIANA